MLKMTACSMGFGGFVLCFLACFVVVAAERRARQAGGFFSQSSQGCSPPASCISITSCTAFADKAARLTPANIEFLKSVTCGFEGSAPKVCCPRETQPVTQPPRQTPPTRQTPRTRPPTEAPLPVTAKPRTQEPTCGDGGIAITRVVGGANADLGDWPWAVAIFVDNDLGQPDLACGGSIINDEYILTAAHCIVSQSHGGRIPAKDFSVRLGDLDLSRDDDGASPVTLRVSRAIPHANFDVRSFHNDIGLLKLSEPINWTNHIKPICLPTKDQARETFDGKGTVLVGWGTVGFEKAASPHLQYVQFPIQSQSLCQRAYAPFRATNPIIRSQMCAGVLTGKKDACQGDSGGPLVMLDQTRQGSPWILVGIVSYGLRCAEPGFPGIYTRVTSFLDWIDENAT